MTNDHISNQQSALRAEGAQSARVKRQRIGRRLGVEPYYTIVAQDEQQLLLDSRPELNLPVARRFLQVSTVFWVLTALIVVGGVILVPSVGLGPVLLLLLPLLIVGLIAMGCFTVGRVLQRVRHRIEVDGAQGKVIYRQTPLVGA
jgi:fatty acid desaturase